MHGWIGVSPKAIWKLGARAGYRGPVLRPRRRRKPGARREGAVPCPDHSNVYDTTDDSGMLGPVGLATGVDLQTTVNRWDETATWSGELKTTIGPSSEQTIEITVKKTLRPPKTDGNGTSKSAVDPTKFAHISGKVVMAGTDEPIPTTLYIAHNAQYESLDRAGKTDADGSFRIERRPRALQSLCAVPVDRMWYPAEGLVKVDLREGPVEDLVLTAAPGVAISGKALDGEGSPVAENWVMLQSKATPRLDELTDIDGRFSFGNLPPLDQPVTLTFGTVKAEVGPLEAGGDGRRRCTPTARSIREVYHSRRCCGRTWRAGCGRTPHASKRPLGEPQPWICVR